MDLVIKDDFLPREIHRKMVELIMTPNAQLPWTISAVVSPEDWNPIYDKKYNYQFIHIFFKDFNIDKESFPIVGPLIDRLNPFAIERIKANLNPWTNEIIEHGMHWDSPTSAAKTAIYYLNTNNGYTLFEDGTKVESVANRVVIFDSNVKHTGTTCTDKIFRSLINVVYVPFPGETHE
jgi:hypothetical protein